MQAARLYGPEDIRIDDVPEPRAPQRGEILLGVKAVGVCGSDLHTYEDGRIGDTAVLEPFILGHEFMGEVLAVGENAVDGNHAPLHVGQRVAVDPATPCYKCEMCEHGHPNLCTDLDFHGLFPEAGALQERLIVSGRNCFPIDDDMTNETGVLLEPLGVAIHALDLGKLQVARSVAIIGCGPIGLLILRLAKLSGAHPIYATDCFDWRLDKARAWGATETWHADDNPEQHILDATEGRGVDVVFEAAWADQSVQQAAEMARYGGRVVLVGIPGDDRLFMQHSTVRRKGLTIMMARRMKHTYSRAIQLARQIDLDDIVSHRMTLEQTPEAFRINKAYEQNVHKIIINV